MSIECSADKGGFTQMNMPSRKMCPQRFWHFAISDVHWQVVMASILAQATENQASIWYTLSSRTRAMMRSSANTGPHSPHLHLLPTGTPLRVVRSLIARQNEDRGDVWWLSDAFVPSAWFHALTASDLFSTIIISGALDIYDAGVNFPVVPSGWRPYYTGQTLSRSDRPPADGPKSRLHLVRPAVGRREDGAVGLK